MSTQEAMRKRKSSEVPLADFVPFGAHVTDDIVKLKNGGGYLATWRLQGISFETAEDSHIKYMQNQLNNFVATMAGGNYAIYQHRIGRKFADELEASFPNAFCARFNSEYNALLASRKLFLTELYVSVIYRPSLSKIVGALRSTTRTEGDLRIADKDNVDHFQMVCSQVHSSLKVYDPTRLTSYSHLEHLCSEPLRFYGFLLNGVWEHVALKRQSISEYLPSSRLFFGDRNGMLQIRNLETTKHVGLLDFQEYPSTTEPGMNNAIFYGDYEYIETHSFSIMNKRDAMKALELQFNRLVSTDDAAASEIVGLRTAMDLLQSGSIQMGNYHYSLAVFGDDQKSLVKNMASAKSALEDGPGYRVAVCDVVPDAAWLAQLPGNFWLRPRVAAITSRNFTAMAPLHNFPSGKRDGNPWGQAIICFESASLQPYYFNYHVSDPKEDVTDDKLPGNTIIIGTTGVGKTTLAMAILVMTLKVLKIRGVVFDKDRGAEIAIRAMGGHYRALPFGERTGFNPFQFTPSKTNIDFCKRLVAMLVTRNGEQLTALQEYEISRAVETVFQSEEMHLRRLAAVDQQLSGVGTDNLRDRLKKWVGRGDYAWVFDNPKDTTDFTDGILFGFDYTEFLDRPDVRGPIMAYLLHVTERLIDGNPFVYLMEEFWKPLEDPYFEEFAKNKQKTIRKQFGLGIFSTQSPSDMLEVPIARTMVEQSPTQIWLPNPKADYDDYVNKFKLTDAEYWVIVGLAENSRMFLVKQNGRSALCRLNLAGMPEVVNILSGTTDNVELLDGIRADVGDDPDVWMPLLHEAIAKRKKSRK